MTGTTTAKRIDHAAAAASAPRADRARALRRAAALLATLVLAGCAGGAATSHRYYLVEPVALEPLPRPGGPLTVEIVALDLPQYLERFEIATREAPGRLAFSETHQWADNLRKNLLRTLGRNLGHLLATPDVGTPLSRTAAVPDHRVQVALEAFERQPDGVVALAARWQVLAADGSVTTHRTDLRSERPLPPGDYDALVLAMGELFGELAQRIASTLLARAPA